ncbi:hypothetical protein [Nitrospirillum iridis]|uniref:Baseplate protein J-like domain-containing protein n=1 Tax=Nitrospirillum iridis TaxID=765888 RepID=A0A7X0AY11_9PROT|nr:hypothetical protein [Nitrospirillum iridis]MBB6250761.1 hypothetical protein [Nitrospirillum iridis]
MAHASGTRPGPVLNTAASQLDRLLQGPAPGQAPVDGRTLSQLLAFSAEYGALINFYDLNDAVDGDWTAFFASDPAIALAVLSGLDVEDIHGQSRRDIHEIHRHHDHERCHPPLRRLLDRVARLAAMLDHGQGTPWAEGILARTIQREIRTALAPALGRLSHHLAAGGLGMDGAFHHLSGAWHAGGKPFAKNGADQGRNRWPADRDWQNTLATVLEALIDLLSATLERVAAEAADALEESLNSQAHAPQAALYIAFATLFRHAQRTVNRTADRLVDFYDGQVLRQRDREAVPDQLYLTFTTDQGTTEADVPAGTHFPAGTDASGQAITYAATTPLAAMGVSVTTLRTLRIAHAAAEEGGPGQKTGVYSGTVALSAQAPAITTPFPLFGDTVPSTVGVLTTTAATLGFAVASETLMLTAGERAVGLALDFTAESLAAVQPALDAIAAQAGIDDPAAVLAQVLRQSLALYYSTGGGWVAVPDFAVLPPGVGTPGGGGGSAWYGMAWDLSPTGATGRTTYTLGFTLGTQADPLVALATTPASKDAVPPTPATPVPTTTVPTLLAVFDQTPVAVEGGAGTAQVYPYALLSALDLTRVSVAAAVEGFTNLTLSGPNGPIDPSTPFALFGSPPVQGAALEMTATELFVKRLDSLDVRVDWYGLPQTSTGFRGYYQGYVVDPDGNELPPGTLFTNQSFLAAFTVADPGWWTLATATGSSSSAVTYLFRTEDGDDIPDPAEPVLPASVFAGLPVSQDVPPASYDPATGALCLTLTDPTYAFGDTLYASNVMAAALRELPDASACEEECARQNAGLGKVAAAAGLFTPVERANATASDDDYTDAVSSSLDQALSGLAGTAVTLLDSDFATLPPDQAATWQSSLETALKQAGGAQRGGLLGLFSKPANPSSADVCDALRTWLAANGAALSAAGATAGPQAQALLDAAKQVSDTVAASGDQAPAVARPKLASSLTSAKTSLTQPYSDSMQACITACEGSSPDQYYPNQPWLPSAAQVSLSYTAADTVPGGIGTTYYHLVPFSGTTAVVWNEGATAPLLAPIDQDGALYIGLTGVAAGEVPVLTLLAQLTSALVDRGTETPPVTWAMASDGSNGASWIDLTPPDGLRGDDTDGLRYTGIVTLGTATLAPGGQGLAWLRASVQQQADAFPLLAGLVPNALVADWIGPGGAETLDTPLPAGTITTSDPTLDGIATIDQPLPSTGGRSKAVGRPFHVWMAERLRHKNRGVQAWDYARLVLADYPTLWQVAVVTPGDGADRPPPGAVRLVLVAGPSMPDVTDATTPMATDAVLASVRDTVQSRISPFITLAVENPPYVRLTVTASVVFRDVGTVAELGDRLDADLVAWLSPWPAMGLGPRPEAYWTKPAIATFIRHRPYVLEILTLSLSHDAPELLAACHYLTSAAQHEVTGTVAATRPSAASAPSSGAGAGSGIAP